MKHLIVLIVIIGLFGIGRIALAADFSWQVNCEERDDGQQLHYWVGYTASEDMPGGQFAYVGNGPGIYFDTPLAGEHPRVVDVLLPTDLDIVTLYEDAVSITISSETAAPDCNAPTGLQSGHLDKDDQGHVNNADNPRGNTCYGAGQVCKTETDWIVGWYRMHS
jgi:hypothetical protein